MHVESRLSRCREDSSLQVAIVPILSGGNDARKSCLSVRKGGLPKVGEIPHNAQMGSFSAPQYALIDKVGMPHVMEFIVKRLSIYNTVELDWVKLLPLRKHVLLHGECMFPYEGAHGEREHGFRIRASVNVNMAPPFHYDHWARIPSSSSEQGWKSGEQRFHFADLEECAVHTLAHECFHFLSETNQVGEKNTEANANWWADGWLAAFKLKRVRKSVVPTTAMQQLELPMECL